MRKLFTILLLVLSATVSWAQTPQKMNYQAVIRNADGTLVSNKTVGIRISILQGSATGTQVYGEALTPKTDMNGLVSLEFGGSAEFSSIDWGKGPFYVKTETDPTGGTSYTITGTSQLLSMPYALHAKTAETLAGGFPILSGVNKGDLQYWNGTAWVIVPVGQPGQYLQLSESGIPVWTGSQFASLTTTDASSITTTSAVTGGFISGNGGSPITAAGICYGKAHNPTTANNVVPDTTRLGQFSLTLTGLTASTTYYARAYAVTSVGTSYGNEITITTPAPIVGDTYQGGIIAYIFQSTDPGYVAGETHGLVVAPNDQGSGITWGCTGTYIGCPATGIGSGAANTAMIVNGCAEAVTAARVCSDLVLNGYSDWFLPSKDELMMAYTNLHTHGLGGFGYVHYWTSSETNANSATKVDFLVGSPTGSTKSYTNKSVRAMRQF